MKQIAQGDTTGIVKKMKNLEDQFMTAVQNNTLISKNNPKNSHNALLNKKQMSMDKSEINQSDTTSTNVTKSRGRSKLDPANVLLRDEIVESSLRLKAAKFGHRLNEIVPKQYNHEFYLPEHRAYFSALTGKKTSTSQNFKQDKNNKTMMLSRPVNYDQMSTFLTETS